MSDDPGNLPDWAVSVGGLILRPLFRRNAAGGWIVCRIYCEGHEPLPSFEDDVREGFAALLRLCGDVPESAELRGDAFWTHHKFSAAGWVRDSVEPKPGYVAATKIKVYRKRKGRRGAIHSSTG